MNEDANVGAALDAALEKWSSAWTPEKRKLVEQELLNAAEAYVARYGLMGLIEAIHDETAWLYQS